MEGIQETLQFIKTIVGFINHYLMYPVLFLILIGLLMVLKLM